MVREFTLTTNNNNNDYDDRDHSPEERLLGPDDFAFFPPGYNFEQLKFGMTLYFDDKMWKIFKFVQMPLVRFLNNRTKIIIPTTFERALFRQGTCRRQQIPLRLAWALTIHKAQGCTLDWLICDLQGCFTAGQAYVALSRAKSMAGLQIRNFSPRHVLTNPLVDGFYQALNNGTVPDFLRDQAGLWWYPLLLPQYDPAWFKMFTEASGTSAAKSNSKQFQLWVANYKPPDGYQGWMGYSDTKDMKSLVGKPCGTSMLSMTRTTHLSPTPEIPSTPHAVVSNSRVTTATASTRTTTTLLDSTSKSEIHWPSPTVTPPFDGDRTSRFFVAMEE